jgi:hypothetical protein
VNQMSQNPPKRPGRGLRSTGQITQPEALPRLGASSVKLRQLGTLLVMAICFILSPVMSVGQDIAGKLVGRVQDSSGAVVASAKVTARDSETGVETVVSSAEDGSFSFESLHIGVYQITVEAPSFQQYISSNNTIVAQKTVTLIATLKPGSSTERVEVNDSASVVDTATPTLQDTLGQAQLASLPIIGRDARVNVELTQPGAIQAENGNNGTRVRVNGSRGDTNGYQIDGTDAIQYLTGNAATLPAVENLQEYSDITSTAGVEYGTSAGSQVSAVIKSGTNRLHGTGWTYFQNSAWNANSWEGNLNKVAKPSGTQRWYGGNLGGPVFIPHVYDGRNKTFWFGSYEYTSPSQQYLQQNRVLTNDERAGNFANSSFGVPVIDGVATPQLDPASYSPMAKYLLSNASLFPTANSPDGQRYSWLGYQTQTVKTTIVKLDEQFSQKHRVFFSMFRNLNNEIRDPLFGIQFGTPTLPNEGTSAYQNDVSTYAFNDTYTLNEHMLNNLVVGITHQNGGPIRATVNEDLNWTNLGVTTLVPDGGVPLTEVGVFINGWGSNGADIWGNYNNPNPNHEITVSENFTWIKGRHSIKAGYYQRIFHEHTFQDFQSAGAYSFSSGNVGTSGNPYADFLLGNGASFAESSTEDLTWTYPAREAYISDQFKVNSRLTLTAGLRWAPFFGYNEVNGAIAAFRPGQQSTVFPNAPLGLVVAGDRGIGDAGYSTKWNNYGPHLGFSYDVTGAGKLVVRGGVGEVFDYFNLSQAGNLGTVAPYGYTYAPANQAVSVTDPYMGQPSPFPYVKPVAGTSQAKDYVFTGNPILLGFEKDFNVGKTYQFNATVEYEPFSSWLVRAGYVGTRGTHLNSSWDHNAPIFIPGTDAEGNPLSTNANSQARRPYPALAQIGLTGADDNSWYNAFQLAVNKHYSNGLAVTANYTYSVTKDEGDSVGSYFNSSSGRNPYNRKADWGLSGYDRPHVFNVLSTYQIPFFARASFFKREIFGGWTLGERVSALSGDALTINSPAVFNAGSSNGAWANYVGGPVYGSHASRTVAAANWINKAAFCPANETGPGCTIVDTGAGITHLDFGNSTRGMVRGPGQFFADLTLTKALPISEKLGAFTYNATLQNIFNHPVLSDPDTNVTDGTFGQINSTVHLGYLAPAYGRVIQMSLHYQF